MKFRPNENELFAKNSSLCVSIHNDSKYDFDIHVYDRRTHRIISTLQTGLITLKSFMDLQPIKPQRKRLDNIRLTREDILCINFLMDFWEHKHREGCKNEKVFKKFRKYRK